ncbi:ATP-binding cassette domain-containing protein [Leptospirillum ferriphilum]|uniref:ATP-binding cassette domain-containing protein n=1 Tax=Leptospirillum ferriphilum TaxID=178606 RepID=UPI000985D53B|nr:ATP-binding cassette domain-containing protein [Leptospirillum ferriphilum]OOH84269.1 ABC transporter ATP-binding protein [Leptospirillum ferriphilum]
MAADRPSPSISLRNVVRTFPSPRGVVRALDDVSFDVAEGTMTGLIGPDGAGKTTLLRILAGILGADSGNVRILGYDPATEAPALQRQIGYMPQKFGLYEDLTVSENLDFHADLHGVPAERRKELYRPLLSMTALAPFGSRLAGKLSGGMKQKLGVACSLVHAPPLLLLDEPTVGVDPVSRRELWEILTAQVRKKNTTLLVSTAYMDEASRFDRVVILYEGKVLGEGRPDELLGEVRGHVFHVTVPSWSSRKLEPRLAGVPGILDAVGEENGVRIVTSNPSLPSLPEDLAPFTSTPVEPRFEDAFMRRLGRASLEKRTSSRSPGQLGWESKRAEGGRDDQTDSIVIRNLTRTFGSFKAVDDLTFNVHRGEIFGLLGANGAGKTTTFRMLSGLLLPTSGELLIDGQNVLGSEVSKIRQRLGYMSQKFSLYSQLTVTQNLTFFTSAYGLSGKRQKDRIAEIEEYFGLTPYRQESAGLLPLGFRQRLALAAALAHEPSILLLDEPTSGVDPLARREFWRTISQLSFRGVSVLVTTHFMTEAEYCDRLAIMAQGKLLALGTPAEIRRRAQSPDTPEPSLEDAFIFLLEQNQPAGLPS